MFYRTSLCTMRHSTYLKVDLNILADNVAKIKRLAPKAKLIPMVKGNAYGHGIVKVARFLTEDLGERRLGVASLGEALEIMKYSKPLQRAAATSKRVCDARRPEASASRDIVVFSDTELRNHRVRRAYIEHGNAIIPMIATVEDLKVFVASPELRQKKLFIKLNTGMNRLGITLEELETVVIPLLKRKHIARVHHLAQHFAASGFLATPGCLTLKQFDQFQQAVNMLRANGIAVDETSTSNSGAIEQGIGINETYVRPGLMMYGPGSVLSPTKLWKGQPCSRFISQVVMASFAPSGSFVGYNFQPIMEDCVVALIPVGYADGFLTYYTGCPLVINGLQGRVHGRVNMDLTAIAFPATPSTAGAILKRVAAGTTVEVWNGDIQAHADAVKCHTYQIMTSLSVRVPRIYK